MSTAGGALFPESSLPLVGTAGAVLAIFSAYGALRHRRRWAWWFLPWTGGLGLTALALLAAWAGPMLVHA